MKEQPRSHGYGWSHVLQISADSRDVIKGRVGKLKFVSTKLTWAK